MSWMKILEPTFESEDSNDRAVEQFLKRSGSPGAWLTSLGWFLIAAGAALASFGLSMETTVPSYGGLAMGQGASEVYNTGLIQEQTLACLAAAVLIIMGSVWTASGAIVKAIVRNQSNQSSGGHPKDESTLT